MASRIEQIIEEIEEYIDGCKYQALSSSKIIVNKDELEELLNELRSKTPEEIKRCLLYTSPSPRDRTRSRMPSSA